MTTSQSLSTHDRDELIIKHLKLVRGIVFSIRNKYFLPMSMFDDMVEDGRVGLVQAARKWKGLEGGPFAPYARVWIRGRVINGLKRGGLFRESLMKKDLPIDKISFPAAWDNVKEIQSRLETTGEHREAQDEPDEQIISQQQLSQVFNHIDKLTPKQAAIITARFKDHKSLRQIARDLGVKKTTVSSAIVRAMGNLKLVELGLEINKSLQNHEQMQRNRRVTNRLRAAIPQRLTQTTLSISTGIDRSYINRILGGTVPSLGVALILAKALGKPVEQLFQLDDRKEADHGNSNG